MIRLFAKYIRWSLDWIRSSRRDFSVAMLVAVMPVLMLSQLAYGQVPEDVVDPLVVERIRVQTVIASGDVSGGGIFYYVIYRVPTQEDVADSEWVLERNVVVRGQMGYEGISRVILAPETDYQMNALYADSLLFGATGFTTPRSGETFEIPGMGFFDLQDPDTDTDGLSDLREFVVATDPDDVDTDDDEVGDGAEIQQGMDPLSGIIAVTGIIGTAPMPGDAYDVIATNNIAIVAGRSAGVSIFNVEASRSPTRIGQIDTPGDASLVSSFGPYVAVADGSAGLTVIDISDPPAASVLFSLNLGQSVTAVTAYGTVAFTGGSSGHIVATDMVSGAEIFRYQGLSGRIWNLATRGDYLYVLRTGSLSVFFIRDGELEFLRHVTSSGGAGAGGRPLRIFIAENQLYTTFTSGLNVFSLADPANPALQERHATSQQGWKQIVFNGNGIGVATVAANSTNDGSHHLSLYNVGSDGTELTFITEFETLGLAASVAIYNGRAFVADGPLGLQVVNYLAFDRFGVAPEITLNANTNGGSFEEGKLLDVMALATDDVQVRNVQFYVNGEISMTDGNYPFGFRLQTPLISEGEATFTLYAVATDTGGNMTTSDTITVTLVPDSTPPRIKAVKPKNGAFTGTVSAITAIASELIDPATLSNSTVAVVEAGLDGLFGTSDDVTRTAALLFDSSTNRIGWNYGSDLPNGVYQISILPPLADLAGNELESAFVSTFKVLGYTDTDGDGLPDFWELEHGLDPLNPDSNNNGTPDGEEDGDFDGLPNIGEFILDRDPTLRDTNDDGTDDGDYDDDLDGLSDGEEFAYGTDPFKLDTDGDGISDLDEVNEGFNPLSPSSLPPILVASNTSSYLNAIPVTVNPLEHLYTLASPPSSYLNATPYIPTEGVYFSAASSPVSYLNAVPVLPDGEVLFSAASSPASYLNAVPSPAESETVIAISPEISYEAQ